MSTPRPPFPRLGEVYRALALALDSKNKDRELDALARDEIYDWQMPEQLRDRLILEPLRRIGHKEFSDMLAELFVNFQTSYLGAVSKIQVDSLDQATFLPLLIKHYWASKGAQMLYYTQRLLDIMDMQALLAMLDPDRVPMNVVLDRFGRYWQIDDLASIAYPDNTGGDKDGRENLRRWRKGQHKPDQQSIRLFIERLRSSNYLQNQARFDEQQLQELEIWMTIARALQWFEEASPIPLRPVMSREIWTNFPPTDIGQLFEGANIQNAKHLAEELSVPMLTLAQELSPKSIKQQGDQESALQKLNILEGAIQKLCPDQRYRYYQDWLWGRWHILAGDPVSALRRYVSAVKGANYRAGENQKKILVELLMLAAYLVENGKLYAKQSKDGEGRTNAKSVLKRFKHQAIHFGLFHRPVTPDTLQDWEIEDFSTKFSMYFPIQGRFPEASDKDIAPAQLPFNLVSADEISRKKPDIKNPGREVSYSIGENRKRKLPQLHYFVTFGQSRDVKAILQADANQVNKLNRQNGSAILCAIQRLSEASAESNPDEYKEAKAIVDLLLSYPHSAETLNTPSNKKRLLPLLEAIQYGDPAIVQKLLEMGASVSNLIGDDVMAGQPLYLCVQTRLRVKDPNRELNILLSRLATKNPKIQEFYRRHIGFGGITGSPEAMLAMLNDKEGGKIFKIVAEAQKALTRQQTSPEKILEIAKMLLDAGANPNETVEEPVLGYTPLMLAAETDDAEAFDLMMRAGGDPRQRNSYDMDCTHIARGWRSTKVFQYLQQNGYAS